jgi:hypothetical protein
MGTKLSQLTEATATADSDIYHLRTTGGIDKKISRLNLFSAINARAQLIEDLTEGLMRIDIGNYLNNSAPVILAGSVIEINGSIYSTSINVSITGSTSNSTWYDILLTPSGSTFTASYIARGTGTYDNARNGLYSGTNRVVACVYRDGSGNFINKNTLDIINRTVKIKIEIGDWNMDTTLSVQPTHGVTVDDIRSVKAVIRNDPGTVTYVLNGSPNTGEAYIASIGATSLTLGRRTTGFFDNTTFDSTSYNRGWITIEYQV